MRHDVFIAGFGGQGVLLAGNLLGQAAMLEGKNVSFFPAYGVEKRGGAAMCTVVISDGPVGSPIVGSPSVSLILNQLSFDKYAGKVKQDGICVVNSTLVDSSALVRDDITLIPIAMNGIALDLGDPRLVNMVAVGAYAHLTGALSTSSLEKALTYVLPERNHRFIPMNLQALAAGAAAAATCM